jgi:hypothetical protein
MESAHRYRLLIIFAALVLCLSICFANAEEVHSSAATQATDAHIFQTSQLHASFLPTLQQGFVHEAAVSTAAPVVSQSVLQQLTAQKPHRFWRGVSFAKRRTGLIVSHTQDVVNANSTQSVEEFGPEPEAAAQTE